MVGQTTVTASIKLVSYVHGLTLVALTGSSLAAYRCLSKTRLSLVSAVPRFLLFLSATIYIDNTIRLARFSLGEEDGGGMHNAPQLEMRAVRELREMAASAGSGRVLVALADPVSQRWVEAFLLNVRALMFPRVELNVVDSTTRDVRASFRPSHVVEWSDASFDLTELGTRNPLHKNNNFSLSSIQNVQNALYFGLGWYFSERKRHSEVSWEQHFRWLRKRGEVFLLQPAALPQRLLLTLISGYGNSSPTRHVDLLINGKKFDEITVDGYTRTLSKPFEAEQPWSQLEFVVHETAQPLPRKFALWKKWVPADARGLNLAISELKVVPANETEFTLPGELDLTSKNGLSSALTNGIYPDRWGGHEMRISLQSPKGASAVEISGSGTACQWLLVPVLRLRSS